MASPQWNARNPAVKRIIQELKEIQRDDNPDILAEALEVFYLLCARCVCSEKSDSNPTLFALFIVGQYF